jgi:hypothetical protein
VIIGDYLAHQQREQAAQEWEQTYGADLPLN